MTTPLVEIKDIHKSYDHNGRTLEVLRGISLDIDQGELIAIVETTKPDIVVGAAANPR